MEQDNQGEMPACRMVFTVKGKRREVIEIIDRWHEGGLEPGRPAVDYFKARTADNEILFLRYVSLFDAWSVWLEATEDSFPTNSGRGPHE